MRSLATGQYSAAQCETQLRSGSAAVGCRFDVLDTERVKIGEIGKVGVDEGVTAATVEYMADRPVPGALRLTLLPDTDLVNRIFTRYVQPFFRLVMPDGGIAEWSMGVFIWGAPNRTLPSRGNEGWDITLGDLTHVLVSGGPGPTGFTVGTGTSIDVAISNAIIAAGFTDTSGVEGANIETSADVVWGLTDQRSAQVTWWDVLDSLHRSGGYWPPWFDLNGRYRAVRQPDLTGAGVSWSYQPETNGLLQSLTTQPDLSKVANRVVGRSQAPGGALSTATADADVVIPGHPLSRGVIKFYIDQTVDSQAGLSEIDLAAFAKNELLVRLAYHQQLTIPTLANPAHEMYDVIGVQWPDDAEFNAAIRTIERQWQMDLFTGDMSHQLHRLLP